MHRVYSIIAAVVLLGVTVTAGAAQQATPVGGGALTTGAEVGIAEISVRLTENGFEAPESVTAGPVLVTFENADMASNVMAAAFIRLDDGMTVDDLNTQLTAIQAMFAGEEAGPSPVADASPMAEMSDMGSPEAGDPFAFLFAATMAGGPGATAGTTAQGIVSLSEGTWAIWDDAFEHPAVAITVTAASPTPDVLLPTANVTVLEENTDDGFAFKVDGTLATGQQLIAITNNSDQPHFMELDRSPSPVTRDQVLQLLTSDPSASPVADLPNPEEFVLAAYGATQSAGTTQWVFSDVQSGSHVLLCFVPDPTRGGTPHAFEGMVDVIDVP